MRKNAKNKSVEGKIPPQNTDIEKAVLGMFLIDQYLIDKFSAEFKRELFYSVQNMHIADAIISLYEKGETIDLLSVVNKLKQMSSLESAGGVGYISSLTSSAANIANVEYHFRLLQETSLKRSIIQVCSVGIQKAYDDEADAFDVFQNAQTDLENALKGIVVYKSKKIGEVHEQMIKESIEVLTKGIKSGVPSGLRMVDNLTNGWQKSDLIILAGRPAMGKTAAAISMCMYPALEEQVPVAIFSLEMSSAQLVGRMQSGLSGVNVSRVVKKQLQIEEIQRISAMAKDLKNAPIFIDDTPSISLLELKGKVRRLVKEEGVKLVVIDYLQLMRSGTKTQSREQEIAEISRGLKGLAKELDIPIIALSQLSRGVEQRGGDRKPTLSDLRESGQIEQDADMVLFCYRPEYYGIDLYEIEDESFSTEGLFMLIVAKHRNGGLGEIPLTFVHELTKVANHGYSSPSVQSMEINRIFVQQPNTQFDEEKKTSDNQANTLNSFGFDQQTNFEDEVPF